MAYFPNGDSGMRYDDKYCSKCKHWRLGKNSEDEGCPIWDAHLLYSYELCNKKDAPGKVILDMLIPMTKDGLYADKCNMFIRS